MTEQHRFTIKSDAAGDTIDVSALLRALLRGRRWIALVFLLSIGAACFYILFLAVPIYSATSVVVMESRESQVMGLDIESIIGGLSSDSSVVNTEVEVLRGRLLMGRVADELKLGDDPEFNVTLQPKTLVSRLKTRILGEDEEVLGDAEIHDSVVSTLLDGVKVTNVPQSLAFRIEVETTSAQKSAQIADAIARLYIDDQVRVKFEAARRAASWLSDEAAKLKAELQQGEDEIRRFQSDMSIASADELAMLDRQLKDTRDRRAASRGDVATLESRQATLAAAKDPTAQADALGDPQLIELAVAAERGDSNARTAFVARLGVLRQQISQDILRLKGQVDSYAAAEQSLVDSINRGSQELTKLEQMLRESEASKLLYEHFQTRLKETVAQQGIQQPDSRVLSQAVRPLAPVAPRQGLVLAMAGIVGLALGSGLVLLRESSTRSIRSASDLEAVSRHVVLGQVPVMPDRQGSSLLPYLLKNPTSAVAEAVRNVRTSILLSGIDKTPQVISLTSSVPGEGKTTITLALGQNLTLMGKKVLVIEGDNRRRMFREYLSASKTAGLVSVLLGETELTKAVQHVSGLGDVLLGEKTTVNAADLLSSGAFPEFLQRARELYDIVLIDTPPLLVVPDARIIAQHVDSVVFVVRWDRTTERQVQDSLHMLETVNARVSGMVLSQIDPKGMRRYGYGDRYGAYAAYGAKYYTTG